MKLGQTTTTEIIIYFLIHFILLKMHFVLMIYLKVMVIMFHELILHVLESFINNNVLNGSND